MKKERQMKALSILLRSSCPVFTGALLLLASRTAVQKQFNYVTNNSSITNTGYTELGGAVSIPAQINGLPVRSIGD